MEIENIKGKWYKKFYKLKKRDSNSIINLLYYIGFPIILYKAVLFGEAYNLKNKLNALSGSDFLVAQNGIVQSNGDKSTGFLMGLVYFVVICVVWKLICELGLIVFRYLESNTKNQ